MQMPDIIILSLLAVLVFILFIFLRKNSKLYAENNKLLQTLELREITIANYEASSVLENFSSMDEVLAYIESGESKVKASKKYKISLSKIELMVKFDRLINKK